MIESLILKISVYSILKASTFSELSLFEKLWYRRVDFFSRVPIIYVKNVNDCLNFFEVLVRKNI